VYGSGKVSWGGRRMSRTLKNEELTQAVAIYLGKYGITIHTVETWIEKSNEYIRATEPLEVTFTPLPDEVIVKSIDAEIKKTRAELTRKVNDLEDQKQRLLAITHQEVEE